MKRCLFLLCFWLVSLSVGCAQHGLPPIYEIKTDSAFITLDTTHFQLLEDPEGTYTLDQVRHSSSFQITSTYDPNRRSHVCWMRMRIKNVLPYDLNLYLCDFSSSYTDMYWQDANQRWQHQRTGELIPYSQLPNRNGDRERNRLFFQLLPGQEITIYQRSENTLWQVPLVYLAPQLQPESHRIKAVYKAIQIENGWKNFYFDGIMIGVLFLAICYNLFIYFSIRDKVYLYFAICLIFFTLDRNTFRIQLILFDEQPYLFKLFSNFFFISFFIFFIQSIWKFIQPTPDLSRLSKVVSLFLGLTVFTNIVQFFSFNIPGFPLDTIGILIEVLIRFVYLLCIIGSIKMIKKGSLDAQYVLLAITPLFLFWLITMTLRLLGMYFDVNMPNSLRPKLDYSESICFAWLILFFSGALINRYNLVRKRVTQQAIEREQLEKEGEIERNRLIASQNERLEQQVEERTAQLKASLDELKATQNQLIQKEKLASLGELTAGIAHEIQNPLNFVNNFSEVSTELVNELRDEEAKADRDPELIGELLGDLSQNLEKITHHGSRASRIVKSMLEHSRTSTGERQPTDLNALCDEYLRLAYHGLRAKDSSFNCELITDFESALGLVSVVPQEMGRVLLNLFNNAFYAVQEKQKTKPIDYSPKITISTKLIDPNVNPSNRPEKATSITQSTRRGTGMEPRWIEIRILDNGTGIPADVKAKIFQPFFTTKPTGEGTGLGLSLSYDIVTKGHGGTLSVDTIAGEFTEFKLTLPLA